MLDEMVREMMVVVCLLVSETRPLLQGSGSKTICLCSDVARTSLVLGHSMGILCLYEILRKAQKHLGGLGHALSSYVVSL